MNNLVFFMQRVASDECRLVADLRALSETLTGLATIRAFRDEARFKQENEHRLKINQRANFCGKKIRLRKVLAATKTISRSESSAFSVGQ